MTERPAGGGRALRLLIIEDDADDAFLLERHLAREGFDVRSRRVDSAPGLREALAEGGWDVVVSDHSMPRFSAMDALEQIKGAGIDVPFIIVSGTIGEERAVAAMKAGASDYIVKDHLSRLAPAIERELREMGERAARRRAESALHDSEARTRAIVEAAVDGIVATDHAGAIQMLNPAAERMFGITAAEARGRPVHTLADDPRPPRGRGPSRLPREIIGLRPDGTRFPAEVSESEVHHTDDVAVTYIVRDVSERKRFEQQLAHRASHDALTGLPNRSLLHDRLELAFARAARTGHRPAVLFLDLDHFKVVNDSLGHTAGDRLLVAVAGRLSAVLRPQDTLARLGGDEFVALVEDIGGEADALRVAGRLQAALVDPFDVDGAEVFASASVGIALASGPDASPESVVRDADAAMYRAKERGRGRSELFDERMLERAVHRLETESALRRAIAGDELRVAYQPILDLERGAIAGVEALVRWQHPQRGLVMPGDFIPLAEDTGLITELGAIVLESACRQARAWGAGAARPVSVSVNLSGRELGAPGFVRSVADTLDATGLDPALLCLEITESMLMVDLQATLGALADLRALGVRLAVDDFGTGYSALAYLKTFPVHELKIDRSFVAGLERDPRDAAIVGTILALAEALGLSVVAEGVETEAQERRLRELGCRLAQGHRFARPALAEDIGPRLLLPGDGDGGRR
ncbi:putative bifunctional diguanylate cyclase/phosphodiesterase [Miltoncostaea marina]|uniref:putative bifunctional diguanylate cyclase/phosphodiesterase n=1 Tax=Miltoncostaea marina TaxID=2843215 RepID=UPI001C3C466B|nr:GGDEF domain-containing response regulator [Miltoncostaea marina]